LEGTRVDLLNYIHGLLDNKDESQLIWLHGTAGVGKSAVAFTVAERMRSLKVTEQTSIEMRLAGTFFFSRENTNRSMTGYFFATLAYQLACNFPSIREDLSRVIRENPALLDPNKSLRDQMEALFLKPLRKLQIRLRNCLPVAFVVDALDECTSETEVTDLISLLGRALREPGVPVIHILLTSRSKEHIQEAIQEKGIRSLVRMIPVKISGKGVAATISLDGADVDSDICIFLKHSFRKLQRRLNFPQPTANELTQLASRAGRRFIVASTMMKFIDDGHHDPRNRLQLMLKFTSELLPGTEVYKLYDLILGTCTEPARAYQHLSIVATLADPLPISQISELLGPGEGRDVKKALAQLRSVIEIPTDSRLPVNIHHSSIRDYVSDPSNCGLPQVQRNTPPHSLLAQSSFRLILQEMPESIALLDALLKLKRQSQAMPSCDPRNLKKSLSFIVQSLEPLQVLECLLWLRGDNRLDLISWLETQDGRAWLQIHGKRKGWQRILNDILRAQVSWRKGSLLSQWEQYWHEAQGGQEWLETQSGKFWLRTKSGSVWLGTESGRTWQTKVEEDRSQVQKELHWIKPFWQVPYDLQTSGGRDWLQTVGGRDWLQTVGGRDWLQTVDGREWLQTVGGREWLQTEDGRNWEQTERQKNWLQPHSRQEWLQTQCGRGWLHSRYGQHWLQTHGGRDWLQTHGGRDWLQTQRGRDWLQMPYGQAWQLTPAASVWVTMEVFSNTLNDISNYTIIPEFLLLPAFQVIQQFQCLPDFLMLPVFLALRNQNHYTSALRRDRILPHEEVIYAMATFEIFASEVRERSRTASGALIYACQNWALHLSRAPRPWDNTLDHLVKSFWNHHLLSWLETQWCLKGLQACLAILFEAQKLVSSEEQKPVLFLWQKLAKVCVFPKLVAIQNLTCICV
jgi:hypothetical protein